MNQEPVRILRLSNSDDFSSDTPPEGRSPAVAARVFQEVTGMPAEANIRIIWPDAALPAVLDGWLDEQKPDAVLFVVSSFWFTYDTVELRLRQQFRWVGRPLSAALHPVAVSPWLARLPVVRAARRAAFRTVGAAPYFTADEVIEVTEACIRRVLLHEKVALAVRGPLSRFPQPSGSKQRECDARLLKVDTALAETCARRGVPYIPAAPELMRPPEEDHQPDGIHVRPEVHARRGEAEGRALAAAWLELNRER